MIEIGDITASDVATAITNKGYTSITPSTQDYECILFGIRNNTSYTRNNDPYTDIIGVIYNDTGSVLTMAAYVGSTMARESNAGGGNVGGPGGVYTLLEGEYIDAFKLGDVGTGLPMVHSGFIQNSTINVGLRNMFTGKILKVVQGEVESDIVIPIDPSTDPGQVFIQRKDDVIAHASQVVSILEAQTALHNAAKIQPNNALGDVYNYVLLNENDFGA